MKLTALLKAGTVGAAVLFAASALAAKFEVPSYYSVKLVDGESSDFNYDKSTRTINLTGGRHQLVMLFEGQFGSSADKRMIQAADPIVVEIPYMDENASYTFDYKLPRSAEEAERYSRTQLITLTTTAGKPLSKSEASYYILKSDSGFSVLRDYRQDLMSLNRLYAPRYVVGSERSIGMTSYGAPVITAENTGNVLSSKQQQNFTMAAPMLSAEQESNLATSSTSGGKVAAPSPLLRQLVALYESADNETKLQFVKYVMSH